MITEKELNSYRSTSMEEPTDEMLAQIMHEAAVIYNKENEEAHKQMICQLRKPTAHTFTTTLPMAKMHNFSSE